MPMKQQTLAMAADQTFENYRKVRYRGLQKNATRAFTALALANIYLGRQRLMAQVRP